MSESSTIQVCHSPFNVVEAWKIPPLNADITIPSWALSAILSATSSDNRSYGLLIGCYVVQEGTGAKILYASDFLRDYLPIHITASGAVVAAITDRPMRFDAASYLDRLADWLEHQGNRWEGPDGSGTYETEETAKMAAKLRDFVARSEGVKSKIYGFVAPFLYLPPAQVTLSEAEKS